MAASMEIIVRKDCDERTGRGGTTVDHSITVVEDDTFDDMIAAWAYARGWSKEIPNPEFDSSQDESEDNEPTITNPLGPVRNMLLGFRERTALLIRNHKKMLGISHVQQQIETGVSEADDHTVVIDVENEEE